VGSEGRREPSELGAADALLVVKLDRLTRSVVDLGTLVERYFAPGKGGFAPVQIKRMVAQVAFDALSRCNRELALRGLVRIAWRQVESQARPG
jgi:hypothetical protein